MIVSDKGAGFGQRHTTLISDYFTRQQRATAIATWALSFPLGTMLGFMTGGWLSSAFGWRHAFMILGIAGLCLLPLMLTLCEPPRGATDGAAALAPARSPSLGQAIKILWSIRGRCRGHFVLGVRLSGDEKWEVNTTGDSPYYTITGAPRVADGKVIIGNAGADFRREIRQSWTGRSGRVAAIRALRRCR